MPEMPFARGSRSSRIRLIALSGVVAVTGLAAAGGVAAGAKAAATFSPPTFKMNIGKPGPAFVYPFGMAWDPTTSGGSGSVPGSLLVDDYNNYNVKRFASDGSYMTTYSSKGNKPGQFSEQPSEIAVNPTDGSFVVAFAFNGYGYAKFDKTGKFLFQVNNPVAYYAPFIGVSATGEVYLVQSTGLSKSAPNIVLMYDSTGKALGQFGTNGTNCSKGQFGVIRGIDVDSFGNVFVNDVSNHCIQVFTSTGAFEGTFGTRSDVSANTRGLKLDRVNHVAYVADAAKEDVAVFNYNLNPTTHLFTNGSYTGTIGTPESSVGGTCSGQGALDAPRDIAVDGNGTVYVSDYACWVVDTFNPLFATVGPGVWQNSLPDPSQPPPLGGLNDANGVAVTPDGSTVYVADTFNQRVQEFNGPNSTTPGVVVQQWGSRLPDLAGQFSMDYPRGVAVDPNNGNVWVDDTRSGYIKEYTAETTIPPTFLQDFGGEGINPGQFFYSDGMAAAAAPPGDPLNGVINPTTLYITDSGFGYFQVMQDLTAIGIPGYQTVAAFPCGTLVEPAVFNGCTSATVDALGNIYAASFNEGVVDVFSPTITTTFPYVSYGPTPTRTIGTGLGGPYGVALSPDGNTLYVTQSTKNDVSAFNVSDGTLLGSWGTKGTANGQLNRPLGIAVDGAGRIYVDDYGNGRVEVFNPGA